MATKEYFPGIGKIKFEGKDSKNPMAFNYYDPEKVVLGKKDERLVEIRYGMVAHTLRRGRRPVCGTTKNSPGTKVPTL